MDDEWSVLMTDSAGAAASMAITPQAMEMLEVEGLLETRGIPVGWDPFRPGEGFTSFYVNASTPRQLHLMVPTSRLPEAQAIVEDMRSGLVDEPVALEPRVGEGVLPARLDRLNVGAFLLAGLWALIYGTWPWFFVFLGVAVFNLSVSLFISRIFGLGLLTSAVRQTVLQGVSLTLAAVFSLRANRLAWEKENRRIYTQEVPRAPDLVVKFERDQRNWAVGGFIVLAYVTLLPFVLGARSARALVLQGLFAAVQLGVLGGLYLWDRSRHPRQPQD